MSELNKNSESLKEGSINLTEEEIQALRLCYANSNIRKHHELIESALVKLEANGGSPGEDNPVGQVGEHNILDVMPGLNIALNVYDYNKHRLQLYAHLVYDLNLLLTNKPLETTKEQPYSKQAIKSMLYAYKNYEWSGDDPDCILDHLDEIDKELSINTKGWWYSPNYI